MNKYLKISLVGLLTAVSVCGASVAFAGNISVNPGEHHAWTDVTGWLDFDASVDVADTNLTGAANGLQIGKFVLNCGSAPVSNCGAPAGNWWVANDGDGNLSGWAWSDIIGWISFCGNAAAGSGPTGGCPGSPTYQVRIDPTNGIFSGWAWNDVIGWISFNCNNSGIGNQCPSSDYKVVTSWRGGAPPSNGAGPGGTDSDSWLESSAFDTRVVGGAAFNSLTWQGSLNGGIVGFQIATSDNANGPWNFIGPSGDATTVYEDPAGPNRQIKISRLYHNNDRYIRYKVWLGWTGDQAPHIDDIIISYSP